MEKVKVKISLYEALTLLLKLGSKFDLYEYHSKALDSGEKIVWTHAEYIPLNSLSKEELFEILTNGYELE